MRILFLDIDGVLNCKRTYMAYGGYPRPLDGNFLPNEILNHPGTFSHLDWVAIHMIQKFCKKHDVQIVLSSTWRKTIHYDALGGLLDLPIIDATNSSKNRGVEIQQWLDEHPRAINYVILDDDNDFSAEQQPHVTLTTFDNGFQYENYEKMHQILGLSLQTMI